MRERRNIWFEKFVDMNIFLIFAKPWGFFGKLIAATESCTFWMFANKWQRHGSWVTRLERALRHEKRRLKHSCPESGASAWLSSGSLYLAAILCLSSYSSALCVRVYARPPCVCAHRACSVYTSTRIFLSSSSHCLYKKKLYGPTNESNVIAPHFCRGRVFNFLPYHKNHGLSVCDDENFLCIEKIRNSNDFLLKSFYEHFNLDQWRKKTLIKWISANWRGKKKENYFSN